MYENRLASGFKTGRLSESPSPLPRDPHGTQVVTAVGWRGGAYGRSRSGADPTTSSARCCSTIRLSASNVLSADYAVESVDDARIWGQCDA